MIGKLPRGRQERLHLDMLLNLTFFLILSEQDRVFFPSCDGSKIHILVRMQFG